MGWPKDPERKALALERFREAQRARFAGPNGALERERLAESRRTPEARANMSAAKRRTFAERPEVRQRIAAGQSAFQQRKREARAARLALIVERGRARGAT